MQTLEKSFAVVSAVGVECEDSPAVFGGGRKHLLYFAVSNADEGL